MSQVATKTKSPATYPRTAAQPPKAPTEVIPHEAIARVAYQKWQKRDCPIGDEQRDWFEAEVELKAQHAWHFRSR
jgi:hypothetical protein